MTRKRGSEEEKLPSGRALSRRVNKAIGDVPVPKKPRVKRPRYEDALVEDVGNIIGKDSKNKRTPQQLEHILLSLQLRKGGATYANIARNLGIDEMTAHQYVIEEIRRVKKEQQEIARDHRQLQLERLNELLLSYWSRRADARAGGMILAIMNKQDSLLGITSEKIDLNVGVSAIEKLTESELDVTIARMIPSIVAPTPVANDEAKK
jgi:hypothetical protein